MKKKFRIVSLLLTVVLLMSAFVTPFGTTQEKDGALTQPEVSHEFETLLISELLLFAEDFVERRNTKMVGAMNRSQKSFGRLDNRTAYESVNKFAAEQTKLHELNVRRDLLREWGEAYTDSHTELTLLRVDIQDNMATLDVEEFSKLYYEKIRGDEPDYTAWVAQRRFVFLNGATGWELVSQELLNNSDLVPITEPTGATENTMRTNPLSNPSTQHDESNDIKARNSDLAGLSLSHGVGILSTFNRIAARDYALRYWQNPNPNYRAFLEDCTNFISQAMRAGGWTDVPGWYRDTRHWWYNWLVQTWSWVGVRHWFEFASVHSRRTTLFSNPRSLWEGEVLQVDFKNDGTMNHSMIVTRKTASEIYLTYRTTNTLNRSFASLSLEDPSARWFPHLVFSQF